MSTDKLRDELRASFNNRAVLYCRIFEELRTEVGERQAIAEVLFARLGADTQLTEQARTATQKDLNTIGWTLRVSGGRGRAVRGGRGRVRVGARGLAPLYTGYQSPFDLRAAGLLDGPDGDLERLAALFAGPAPWMRDGF